MSNLALTYSRQGRHEESATLNLETLELKKKVLGLQHPDTLISMSNLAWKWKVLGRDMDAVELMRETVDLSVKTLGADHPDTVERKGWLNDWQQQRSKD